MPLNTSFLLREYLHAHHTHTGVDPSFLSVTTVLFIYLLHCIKIAGRTVIERGFRSPLNFDWDHSSAMYWRGDGDKYSCLLNYENGPVIYYEIMCDAFLQVTGNPVHGGLHNKEDPSASVTEKPGDRVGFQHRLVRRWWNPHCSSEIPAVLPASLCALPSC